MTDVAVIGAGIVGLATAFSLAERGAPVTVYERGVPGSAQSGGESRIFRHGHDDPRLVAFACEARAAWREWEAHFGIELVSADGALMLGPAAEPRLRLLRDAGVRARPADGNEIAERLPLLAPWDGPALIDEDGGVIRTRAAVSALLAALDPRFVAHDLPARVVADDARAVVPPGQRAPADDAPARFVADEVLAVSAGGEVRAGGVTTRHERVVVCAGRGTAALAATAGVAIPVREFAHVRLAYELRGDPPARLACLQHPLGAYGDPLPGNRRYAVGLGDVADPADLAASAQRTNAFVAAALPGLSPEPVEARHCWVTELPWSRDGIAVWEAGRALFVVGNNLFKHAPALGRALAAAALGDGLRPELQPAARLGEAP